MRAALIDACKTAYGVFITHLPRIEGGIFIASFRPRFSNESIGGVKSKPSPAFPSRVDDWVPGWFLLLTRVDEARKLTIWMKANIGPREAICVKYVLNARESSHGLLVWKRRRRSMRPGSAALRGLRSTLLHFSIPLFSFFFFSPPGTSLPPRHVAQTLRQNQPRSSLSLLCCCSALGRHPAPSTRRCCAAHRVRLRGLSPRPIPEGVE
jgi:hypothetical protein